MRPQPLMLLALLSGCAATHASTALLQAQRAVHRADAAQADERAPYEHTMAQAYLTEARKQASFSSYRSSVELSRQARTWAEQATRAAADAPSPSQDPDEPDVPGGTP